MTTFGHRLKKARKNKALSQDALAKIVGVTRGAVSQWENDTLKPSHEHTIQIASELSVDIQWLISGDDQTPSITKGLQIRKEGSQPNVSISPEQELRGIMERDKGWQRIIEALSSDPDTLELVKSILKLTDNQRKAMQPIVKALLAGDRKHK